MCSYATNDRSNWRRHFRVHTHERPYGCDVCKKTFALKNTLKVHMSGHIKKRLSSVFNNV